MVQPISNLMLASTDSRVNSIFLMQSTDTRVLDNFTRMFVTHTREYEILASLLAGISNTLRVLKTCYEFTCEIFAFIILPEVNIFID